jgi:hypothetical protein
VEFYVEAVDASNQTNSWPRPAINAALASIGHAANALYQVDSTPYTGTVPLFKMLMTPSESNYLFTTFSSFTASDAAVNLTCISLDVTSSPLEIEVTALAAELLTIIG